MNERFGVATTPQVLIGLGIEEPDGGGGGGGVAVLAATAPSGSRYGVDDVPYLLCIGRVDDQKGTGMLWRYFRAYKERHPGPLRLVFVGQVVDPPDPAADIVVTGMIDDEDKWGLLRGARALVAPSPHESFSLTVVEAMTAGVPVLVNAVCGATREHCEQSGAGLWFDDFAEFEAVVGLMTTDDTLHETMRHNGLRYVEANYRVAGDPRPLLRLPRVVHRQGGRSRVLHSGKRRAVAVTVRLLGQWLPTGRAERRGRCPSGTTAMGTTSGGRPSGPESSSPARTGIVVSVEPSPRACAASSRFCTAGKTEEPIVWG